VILPGWELLIGVRLPSIAGGGIFDKLENQLVAHPGLNREAALGSCEENLGHDWIGSCWSGAVK